MKYTTNCKGVLCLLLAVFLMTSCTYKAETLLHFPTAVEEFNFPEQALMADKDTLTGVCFSGGGTRAMNCAVGQMRALYDLQLWEDFDYISSVSGGTWAASIFTYYQPTPQGPQNDDELLGTPLGAGALTMSNLKAPISQKHMLKVVTDNFTSHLEKLWELDFFTLDMLEKADEIWIDGVGQTYLEPFGLYGDREKFFTLDDSSLGEILARPENDHLQGADFLRVHDREGDVKRPYLVMNSSVISPASYLPLRTPAELTVFNYTPLGVGAAKSAMITQATRYDGQKTYAVGGSFIEPFAFGGSGPEDVISIGGDDQELVTVKLEKDHCFRLADAVGTSSSAFAVTLAEYHDLEILSNVLALGSLVPEQNYWTTTRNGTTLDFTATEPFRYGDGGSLENFGVLSLLQRGVTKLLVFVNTDTPIDSCFDARKDIPDVGTIDYDFYTMFADFKYGNHRHNQVFSKADFVEVYDQFKADLHQGLNPTAVLKTTTVNNDWWGIQPMEVEVHFYYNSYASCWVAQLDTTIQDSLALGTKGPFRDFPMYKTVLPTKDDLLVELSPAMAKLLYEYQYWCVYRNRNSLNLLRRPTSD